MPDVQEILDELQDGEIFSTIDLKSGYWQIPLEETCKPMTAFAFNGRQYVFNVLPFGLKNAPAVFMRIMTKTTW